MCKPFLCMFSTIIAQFDPFSEMNFTPSFFNLKVELLLEGMKGADCCYDYKFHKERGFNETYFDQVRIEKLSHFALFYCRRVVYAVRLKICAVL
jgi:hypothetical protein